MATRFTRRPRPTARPRRLSVESLEGRQLLAITPVLETFTVDLDGELAGTTTQGQDVAFGGFSGLFFDGYTEDGNLKFVANTDRGPNGETVTGTQNRPFLLPDFAPELVRLELDRATGDVTLTERIQLKVSDTELLTGLPNINLPVPPSTASTPYHDEIPIDLFGATLTPEPLGGDVEGVAVDADGSFWMPDEYRPSIYHFDSSGVLIDRFVPIGTAAAAGQPAGTYGTEALPAVLAQRRQNRGFEGVALKGGKVYAFVQSPIRNPVSSGNSALNARRNVRVVEFNPATLATRQFIYVMDNPNLGGSPNSRADKIGDAVAIQGNKFLVIERDDDFVPDDDTSTIEKKVYSFSLAGATDISGIGLINEKTVDQMTAEELAAAKIRPIAKSLFVDLNTVGYNTIEKVEGIAFIDEKTIAVINDNDFGVANIVIDNATGTFTLADGYTPQPELLGLITFVDDDDDETSEPASAMAIVATAPTALDRDIVDRVLPTEGRLSARRTNSSARAAETAPAATDEAIASLPTSLRTLRHRSRLGHRAATEAALMADAVLSAGLPE